MSAPSIVGSQQQTFLRLWQAIRPHVRSDRNLPARIQQALRRREFGARDRRLYRELLYTAVRLLPWVEQLAARDPAAAVRAVAWLAAPGPAVADFRAAQLGDWPDPPPADLTARAERLGVTGGLLPEWFRPHCPAAFAEPNAAVLQTRTPLWIRVQGADPAAVAAEFAARGWPVRWAECLPGAGAVLAEADVTDTAAYRAGRIEIQDLGSQFVLASADVAPGAHWLDACAGAGGKTLQLAGLVGPRGRVDAGDVRPEALAELRRRADRGGFANVRVLDQPPARAAYDGVLVDAPCSGSGTWRRAPHLKWCTSADDVADHAARQAALLRHFAACVRSGGRLLYATCSLSRRENEEVVAGFTADRPGFQPEAPARSFGGVADEGSLTILPATHDTDGFFVAAFRRAS